MRRFALCLLLLVVPLPASAGGLFTPDVGSIGLGRGGAWTGRASDVVGALYYNPAGLWQVDGWTVSGGLNLHRTHRTFQRADGPAGPYELTESTPHVRPIPEVGIAWGLPKPDLTIALGLYAPPAPIQQFDPDGAGRYRLIDQELIQGNIVLAAALRPVPWLSFGASFQLLYMELTESFKASAAVLASGAEANEEDPDWDVTANFTASSIQPYFSVGVMVMPLPWLRIGASFEPPYKFKGKGHATLDGVLGTESSTLELLGEGALHVVGADDDITVNAGLPGHLRFGIDLEPIPRVLMFGVDFHLEIWNGSGDLTAGDVDMDLYYDDASDDLEPEPLVDYLYRVGLCPIGSGIGVDCGDEANGGAGSNLERYSGEGGDGSMVVPASYRNTWSLRLGAEVRPLPFVGLRAGWLYEPPAIPEDSMALTMHDGHKHMVAGGISLLLGAGPQTPRSLVEVHVTYSHIFYKDRVIEPGISRKGMFTLEGVPSNNVDAGTYTAAVNQLGINVAVHLGAIGQRAADNEDDDDEG